MENVKGMTACKVCGRDFPLIAEAHYISRERTSSGLSAALSNKEPTFFDSFDCPHCGCQNCVQVYNRIVGFDYDGDYDENDEETEGDTEPKQENG